MKTRLAGILLLLCLVLPIGATFGWLQMQKYTVRKQIKRQMMTGMDRSRLVLLKFTTADAADQLHWEHSREFEYQQQMYDVVEQETHGDTIYYWCWHDHEETELNQQLGKLTQMALGNNPLNKERQLRLLEYFEDLYLSDTNSWQAAIMSLERDATDRYLLVCGSCLPQPPAPPPKF